VSKKLTPRKYGPNNIEFNLHSLKLTNMKKIILPLAIFTLSTSLLAHDGLDIGDDFVMENNSALQVQTISALHRTPKSKIFLIGEKEYLVVKLDMHNDNWLLGFPEYISPALDTGDDRGRTFSLGLSATLEGSTGSVELSAYSNLFSRLATGVNLGSEDYPHYQQYTMEENKISLKARILKDKFNQGYLIIGASYTEKSDQERLTGAIQTAWHESWAGSKGWNTYENLPQHLMKRDMSATVGIGKKINLNSTENYSLDVIAEGEIELSSAGNTESKVNGKTEIVYQGKKLKMAISAQAAMTFDQKIERNFGAEIEYAFDSFGIKLAPGMGVYNSNTNEDRDYNSGPEWVYTLYLKAII